MTHILFHREIKPSFRATDEVIPTTSEKLVEPVGDNKIYFYRTNCMKKTKNVDIGLISLIFYTILVRSDYSLWDVFIYISGMCVLIHFVKAIKIV